MKLSRRISVFTSLLLILTMAIATSFFLIQWFAALRFQLQSQALDLAETISRSAQVVENIVLPNGHYIIQREMEHIRLNTRIESIRIVNIENRVYADALVSRLGTESDSALLSRVLRLGVSMTEEPENDGSARAAAPVYRRGVLQGAVEVELYQGRLFQESKDNLVMMALVTAVLLVAGLVLANRLAALIKRSIFGLEPDEIARLLTQQRLILAHLDRGVVFTDMEGSVSLINDQAKTLLGFPVENGDGALAALESDGPREVAGLNGRVLLRTALPVLDYERQPLGRLAIFEDLTEARRRAEELTGMRQLTTALRSQNHEFMNKLHTISGLIQLGEYGKALEYVSAAAQARGDVTEALTRRIREPSIAGLLLAKYNRAAEARIHVVIDKDSRLSDCSPFIDPEDFAAALGNLIENAYEELLGREDGEIFIGIYEGEDALTAVVEDNGRGIPEEFRDPVSERGKSTKGEGRGFGLAIVREIARRCGATLSMEGNHGTAVEIEIPRKKGATR